MNLAFADGGRAFLGTVPLDGMLAAAAAPNKDPIPARWADGMDRRGRRLPARPDGDARRPHAAG